MKVSTNRGDSLEQDLLFTIFPFVQNQDTYIFAFFSAFGVTVVSVEFKTGRAGLILTVVLFKL